MVLAYGYIAILGSIFYSLGFYSENRFFNWGTPVVFFGKNIDSSSTFYLLHLVVFVHQLVNNSVNSIVYPWIINFVQDPKCRDTGFSKTLSLILVNFFDLYSEIDMVLIIMGFTSQISFVVTICIANLITGTYINSVYIDRKKQEEYIGIDMV